MATISPRGHSNGGRPSKGERHLVSARIPKSAADELRRAVDRQGTTVSDYIASLIRRALEDIDVEGEDQGRAARR
jgi:hypothetical protein